MHTHGIQNAKQKQEGEGNGMSPIFSEITYKMKSLDSAIWEENKIKNKTKQWDYSFKITDQWNENVVQPFNNAFQLKLYVVFNSSQGHHFNVGALFNAST